MRYQANICDLWIGEMKDLCEKIRESRGEVEQAVKYSALLVRLQVRIVKAKKNLQIENPALLLAMMDAYEVTREEGMLQEVLNVVSEGMGRLEVSAESVRLLAYCYYYVEEEECAVRAKQMLDELRRRGGKEEELAETEKVVEELIGE